MIIYKATNLINNKVYIGQTIQSLAQRKAAHFYKSKNKKQKQFYFNNALNKHGKDNFYWEVIETIENKNILGEKEKYWIKFFKSNEKEFGYNLTGGGEGFTQTKETKLKLRLANLGKKLSPETKLKMSLSRKGRIVSQETRDKIRKSSVGRKSSSEAIEKNRIYHLGRKQSKETIEKRVLKNIGKKRTLETKQKIGAANKGRQRARGVSEKIKLAKLWYHPTEETKRKTSESMKKTLKRKRELNKENNG